MSTTVFISSTSHDLLDHRVAVARALLNAGYHPIDMTNFMARPEGATTECLKEVAGTDLFVGIYAWRYGFRPSGAEVSINEQEFLEAERLSKPCFCFIVDENHSWPEEYKEQGLGAQLLREFKARLDLKLVRSTFTDPEDLAMKVLASLQRYEREHFHKRQSHKAGTMPQVASSQSTQQAHIGSVNFSDVHNSSIRVGNISTTISVGGDFVGNDKIESNSEPAKEASEEVLLASLAQWRKQVETKIATLSELEIDAKKELIEKTSKVELEAAKGANASLSKLERLLNTMFSMSQDILDVTVTTLQNPFAGVGLVLQKINDQVKLERQ